jgi:putative membrane protein
MYAKNRFLVATLALLAVGAVALAAYAADNDQANPNQPNPNQPAAGQANPNQPATNPPSTYQPNQPGATQPGTTQPGTNQAQPYQVRRVPGAAGQTEIGQLNQQGKQNVDLFLIPCLINGNNGEVTLGNLAVQRGQSQEVKDFAQQMVKDHTAAAQQFQQLQNTLNQQMRPQNPANTPVAAALFQINQEIEQTCLANAQRELEQKSGSEFDPCYIGMQIGMHMHATSVLSVLKNHVTSPDLKKAIEEASDVTSRHLEHAKKIAKDLERSSSNERETTRESQK